MAKCTECGAAVAEDLKFCGYCGAKLNIVSEHLGTQILGNTQVIMAALERIAPGAAQQYTVLGSVTSGKMAGGVLLCRGKPPVGKYSHEHPEYLWSDGQEMTPVLVDLLNDAYEREAIDWNRTLTERCPRCLSAYHWTRGLLIEQRMHVQSEGVDSLSKGDDASPFQPRVAPGCPACMSADIMEHKTRWEPQTQWYVADFERELGRLCSIVAAIERNLRTNPFKRELFQKPHGDDYSRLPRSVVRQRKQEHEERQRERAELPQRQLRAYENTIRTLEDLREQLPRYVEADLAERRSFAESLTRDLREPVESFAEWRRIRSHGCRLGPFRVLNDERETWLCIPQSMADNEGVLRHLSKGIAPDKMPLTSE